MLGVALTLAVLGAGPSTTQRNAAWRLASVAADQRSLRLVYEGGGCARPDGRAMVAEGASTVRIRVRQTVVDDPYVACAAYFAFLPLRVRLEAPLDGRLVTGGPRMEATLPVSRVPRVVGLRRRDARRALAGQELEMRDRGRGRVVRAQRPRSGARVGADRTVTVRLG